jgi:hypothetical protein
MTTIEETEMARNLSPARLDDSTLAEIRSLENEMGKVLVALDPVPGYAELSADELQKLRDVEQRLGVVMVAYER